MKSFPPRPLAASAALSCLLQAAAFTVLRREGAASARAAGTPLPPRAEAALRSVERGVKSLEVPAGPVPAEQNGTLPSKAGGTSRCAFLGGLASAQLSAQCCKNIHVVTQRHLDQYGMASKCEADWECEADGVAPLPAFETQSLSALCGEPGCLPAVVDAIKQNPTTAGGAEEMGDICSTLASLGGSKANPEVVSNILAGGDGDDDKKEDDDKKKGRRGKGKRRKGSTPRGGGGACFPGDATVHVQGSGQTALSKIRVGDVVQVQRRGRLVYEPILTFLHVVAGSSLPFVTVHHGLGSFRASAAHIVLVAADDSGVSWTSKLVGNLQIGDKIYAAVDAADGALAQPSVVSGIRHGYTSSGMFAPLTPSGTVVVDGVVASNYASPSERKQLPHSLAHAFLFPVRLYHKLGLGAAWKRLWGDEFSESKTKTKSEELHPYLRVMWKGLKLDMLLATQ